MRRIRDFLGHWRSLRAAVLMLALGACSRPAPPDLSPAASVAGRWRWSEGGGSLEITLVSSGTQLTGTGSVSNGLQVVRVRITGTYAVPNVTLRLESSGLVTDQFRGRLVADSLLRGVLETSPGDTVVFVRVRE
jgi:hypothetical protein